MDSDRGPEVVIDVDAAQVLLAVAAAGGLCLEVVLEEHISRVLGLPLA